MLLKDNEIGRIAGVEGTFRHSCVDVLATLRRHGHLFQVLDHFHHSEHVIECILDRQRL